MIYTTRYRIAHPLAQNLIILGHTSVVFIQRNCDRVIDVLTGDTYGLHGIVDRRSHMCAPADALRYPLGW